jgi:hypothetical protein
VGAGRVNLDLVARPQVDGDDTQELASIPWIVSERYVDSTNQRLITRDAGEQPVLDVRLKLVGDDDVFARQQDAHTTIQGKWRAKDITS